MKKNKLRYHSLLLLGFLAKGEDIIPLIGARRVSQLQNSMESLDVHLSESDVKRIEEAIPVNEIAGGSFSSDAIQKNGMVVHQ
ncbi:hypothetical protein GCM10020331_001330 [Ectobacillus funiculus]